MKKDMSFPKLINIGEAARMLNVSQRTLHRWEKEKKLKSIRLVTNGKRKYNKEDIVKFIENGKGK